MAAAGSLHEKYTMVIHPEGNQSIVHQLEIWKTHPEYFRGNVSLFLPRKGDVIPRSIWSVWCSVRHSTINLRKKTDCGNKVKSIAFLNIQKRAGNQGCPRFTGIMVIHHGKITKFYINLNISRGSASARKCLCPPKRDMIPRSIRSVLLVAL